MASQPRNVRPSFLKVSVDGRETDIATGPRARTGEMTAELLVRCNGSAMGLLDIEAIASADAKTVLVRVTDKRTQVVIFEETITQ